MGPVVRLQGRAFAAVTLLVDTSVWSLALRRDAASSSPQVRALRDALEGFDMVVTTGLVLQELLQGFSGPRARSDIIDRFAALPFLSPDREDHVEAAEIRNRCRRAGVQVGTIQNAAFQAKGVTDSNGLLSLPGVPSGVPLVAIEGESKAFVGFYRGPREGATSRIACYTDRPVYRPGDTGLRHTDRHPSHHAVHRDQCGSGR